MRLTPQHPYRPAVAMAVAALALAAGCATTVSSTAATGRGPSNKIVVVAVENFWGSIAKQLGGTRVSETSIITNPSTDPHDYEPTAADARTIALAQLVIVNGIGYDPWVARLIAANPVAGRRILTAGRLFGLRDGDNPHQWYSAAHVRRVIQAITADYRQIDPPADAYFQRRRAIFETKTLRRYNELIKRIRAGYAGTPIGASESVVSPLAATLGLKILTPRSFLKAISEGSEPTAHDKSIIDAQIKTRQIKIYIYNSQNATPDIAAQVREAKAAHIPVTTVTETLVPASATFQQWQVTELQGIYNALQRAGGTPWAPASRGQT